MSSSIFALVESDELQRLCSADAIQGVGYDCLHFKTAGELLESLERGASFQAAGIALHPRAADERAAIREICRRMAHAIARPMLFMAHPAELERVRPSLMDFLVLPGTSFICTPMQDEELRLRLDLLAYEKKMERAA